MAAHLYRPITDAQGNLRTNSTVTLYADGTTTKTTAAFFSDEALTQSMPNPFDCTTGIIDVYFATPLRLDVGVTPPGGTEVIIHGIDAEEPSGGGGPWTAYTPVVTGSVSNPTFAPGTVFGRYQINGNTLYLSVWCINGPAVEGSGDYQYHLPPGITPHGPVQYQVGSAIWLANGGPTFIPGVLLAFSGDTFVHIANLEGSLLGQPNFPPGSDFFASGVFEIQPV